MHHGARVRAMTLPYSPPSFWPATSPPWAAIRRQLARIGPRPANARSHAGPGPDRYPRQSTERRARPRQRAAGGQARFPSRPAHQRRSADGPRSTDSDDGCGGCPGRAAQRPARRGACSAHTLQHATAEGPRAEISAADAARAALRGRGGYDQVHALRVREPGRHAALPHRLLHHGRQERHQQIARRRQENAARRLSRHQPTAARQAGRLLRHRARSPSAIPTSGTCAKAATATASGCTARRATPTAAPRAPATAASC